MKLIAEGVETPEQMQELMKNGADYFQGYLFSKPLNSEELVENVIKFFDVDPVFEMTKQRIAEEANAEGAGDAS
jgi:c-di-GMP-related signal transduction protein